MNLTDEQQENAGNAIAKILQLRRDPDYKDRWRTTWGNKTAIGVFRTVARMVDDVREGKELTP